LAKRRPLGFTDFYRISLSPVHHIPKSGECVRRSSRFSSADLAGGVLTGEPEFEAGPGAVGALLGIVRFALRYPHTFSVVAGLIMFLGVTAAVEMPTDIFPEIDIPWSR
jgi:hypothetical protein